MHAPITNRNHYFGLVVDGMGGVSEYQSFANNLDENFQGIRYTGRQAQALPQNLEAWCPGSLRTNWENPHLRAGVTQPTSAQRGYFEMGSWLDHPRSHYDLSCMENHFADWARLSSKPGSRKWVREFLKNSTFGFYFGSRK